MRVPSELYQIETMLAAHLPTLRPAQQRGLALWVYGTILAQSACQSPVITAVLFLGRWQTLRQRLREWLADGPDKAAPCHTQVEVSTCFAPLLRWLFDWWHGQQIALGEVRRAQKLSHRSALVLAVPIKLHLTASAVKLEPDPPPFLINQEQRLAHPIASRRPTA